jgi:hypothetical protein
MVKLIDLMYLRSMKLKERISDPDSAEIAELILDTVTKEAKAKLTEARDSDIPIVVKKLVRETEKDIDLINSHSGDPTKWVQKLEILKKFMPAEQPKWDEARTEKFLTEVINQSEGIYSPGTKGKLMGYLKQFPEIDMALAAKIVNRIL